MFIVFLDFLSRIMSELVQHDSVSTVQFKFQLHHLFHIFKFDVHEFRFRTTWQVFRSFNWTSENLDSVPGILFQSSHGNKAAANFRLKVWERARGSSSFAWLHSFVIFMEWMAVLNVLVLVGRQLLFLERFLLFALCTSMALSFIALCCLR